MIEQNCNINDIKCNYKSLTGTILEKKKILNDKIQILVGPRHWVPLGIFDSK